MTPRVKLKFPSKLPTWVCKAIWDSTAVKLKVEARNEAEAVDKAWMKVSRMEGGMSCLRVTLIEKREL